MAPNAKFMAEVAAALSDKAEPIIVVRRFESLPLSWTSHAFANAMLLIYYLANNGIAIAQGCKAGRRSLTAIQLMAQVSKAWLCPFHECDRAFGKRVC